VAGARLYLGVPMASQKKIDRKIEYNFAAQIFAAFSEELSK